MAHRCYISFKTEDLDYKETLQDLPVLDIIDKSLNDAIDSNNEDYILQKIREEYLSDSTVTIHLIGPYGAEHRGPHEQRFIKRELQASLYDGANNTKSGIIGIVLPGMTSSIYRGAYSCARCGNSHNHVAINDSTTIREFSYNYYIPNNKCSHNEDDRFCVLARWEDFEQDPNPWIDKAFAKRESPIASKTQVYP